uniref:Serpentine receptor class gamma n=1 Tax=Panagrellus redivivus TaxID=6233 RepID=A0A7E4VB42_PANRE
MSKFIWPFFVIAFIIALSQSWFYYWCTFTLSRISGSDSYALVPALALFATNGSLRSAIIGFIAATSCILLNRCAAILLFRRKQAVIKSGGINLFFIAFIDFVFHLLHAVTEIIFVVIRNYPKLKFILTYTHVIRTWIIDFDCLHRPWILFIMSKNVRYGVIDCVSPRKTSTNNNQINDLRQAQPNVNRRSITAAIPECCGGSLMTFMAPPFGDSE